MAVLHIDLDYDDTETQNQLRKMGARVKNFRPVFNDIRDELQDSWRENFTSNGSLVGGWAPLNRQYGSWKSVRFPGSPTLVRSGRLFRSLTDLKGSPNKVRNTEAFFGTNLRYAKFHQYGTSKMPKRQIIFEPNEAKRKWGGWVSEYVVSGEKVVRRG